MKTTNYINKSHNSLKILRKLAFPMLVVFLSFYLIFHVLSGERGIYAMLKEERKLASLKKELQEVSKERKDTEARVRLMSSGSLDKDMLDEQARLVLDAASENEVIIPLHK